MREAVRGVVIGLVVLALLGAIASRAGWITSELPRPAGTGAWMLSRVTGLTAFVAISLDVIVGLLLSTHAADRWMRRAHAIDLHSWLSPLGLALVFGHVLVLLADGYIRFDLLDLVIPFVAPYRPLAVGLGVIAAYLLLVVHLSFGFRRRLGTRRWRQLHYLSFVVFVASAIHAIVAGTDAGRPWVIALYAAPVAIVAMLIAYRIGRRHHGVAQGIRGRAG